MSLTSRRTARTPCPQCGESLSGACGPGSRAPRADDLSVCAYCATPLRFVDDEGRLARLTPTEIAELPTQERRQLLRFMDLARLINHDRKGRRT